MTADPIIVSPESVSAAALDSELLRIADQSGAHLGVVPPGTPCTCGSGSFLEQHHDHDCPAAVETRRLRALPIPA